MSGEIREFLPLFPQKNITHVLSAILLAGENLRKKTAYDHEDWISRRLYGKLIRIFPFRDGPLDIRLQPEIVSVDSDDNMPAGKIDFIVSCGLGAENYFAIEAKRLRVRSRTGKMDASNDDYVNDGMMRFVTGQYAPLMSAGAMLGYVFDGDIRKARAGVAGYILKKAIELKLMEPKQLTMSSIMPAKSAYETKHNLQERHFTIFHIFLNI